MEHATATSLVKRLREAQGPDRELDRLIWEMAFHDRDWANPVAFTGSQNARYAFTASLDAICWLISIRLPDWNWTLSFSPRLACHSAGLWSFTGRLAAISGADLEMTPALALCIAFVRTLAAENQISRRDNEATP